MTPAPRGRQRRSSGHRDRTPRHVEAVLDPNWQSPYSPSAAERETHRRAIRSTSLLRVRPMFYAAVGLFLLTVAIAVAGLWIHALRGWWWPLVGLLLVGAVLAANEVRGRRLEQSLPTLAASLLSEFTAAGTAHDDQRLATIVDRLAATFGLNSVAAHIVRDEGYNAALLPGTSELTLIVTSGLMRDFELIEIEGVVAHLMARQRLNLLERQAAAALSKLSFSSAHELAGDAAAYRADEVAAASIRYPLGLSRALAKCAAQTTPPSSFFSTPRYAATRWVWFNLYADHASPVPGDLDEPLVRSRALAEW